MENIRGEQFTLVEECPPADDCDELGTDAPLQSVPTGFYGYCCNWCDQRLVAGPN